jgi:hypothetical protein
MRTPRPPFRRCAGRFGDRDGPRGLRPAALATRVSSAWGSQGTGKVPEGLPGRPAACRACSASRACPACRPAGGLGLHHGHVPAARAHAALGLAWLCGLGHLARLHGLGRGRRRAAHHRTGRCGRARRRGCGLMHRAGENGGCCETCRRGNDKGELSHGMSLRNRSREVRAVRGPGNSQCGERSGLVMAVASLSSGAPRSPRGTRR